MTITIRDVAQRLNLSITTVSRALDGYADVSPQTREEVIRVANEMGYVPNVAARQLRRQKADTIGYVLPSNQPRFIEPFYSEFVAGLGDEAPRHRYDLRVSAAPPNEEAERQIYQRWVQGHKVDGFILNRIRLQDWRAEYLSSIGFPFVSLERPLNVGNCSGCAWIEVDGRAGMMRLMAHLVEMGHRRIAYVGGPDSLKLQADRFAGYQAGLVAASIPYNTSYVISKNLTSQGGYEAAQALMALPVPPTAITCANDTTAIGVLHAAHERGLRVGQDLAVAGFDGIAEAEHTQPPLTTLDQPLYQIAGRLVNMLLTIITGEVPLEQVVSLQPELRLRASTIGP